MLLKRIAEVSVALAVTAVFAAAANAPAQTSNTTSKATRDLKAIQTDAAHVRTAALGLEKVVKQPGVKWVDCDAQWNAIKPAVEDMDLRLSKLNQIKSSLASSQQSQIDQAAKLVQSIRTRTHQLRALLDKQGVQPADPMFANYGRDLANESRQLERVPAIS